MKKQPKQIPILFSTPMVQAILEGRKTMTRRLKGLELVNVPPNTGLHQRFGGMAIGPHIGWKYQFWDETGRGYFDPGMICPYGKPGDVLWVREEHYRFGHWIEKEGVYTKTGRQKWMFVPVTDQILYEPPEAFRKGRHHKDPYTNIWHKRLARFMPKAAARIWLQVTDIRVERLQDISEENAKAEGVKPAHCESNEGCPSNLCKDKCAAIGDWWNYMAPNGEDFPAYSAKESFESLWQSINGADSWAANPWVWVISFKVLSTSGKPENLYTHANSNM